jgi:Tol biopolymer transport system component
MRYPALPRGRDLQPNNAPPRWLLMLAVVAPSTFFAAPLLAADKPASIWVMDANGSNPHQLVRLEGYAYHRMPRWSRDGRRIAFYAANKNGFAHEVFVANADGSNPRKLAVGDCPDWSADDKQLLIDTWIQPGFVTEVVNVDGSGRERLGKGSSPRWSPDGSQMVILRATTPLVIDLASDEELTIFDRPLAKLGEAVAWSPDGKFLALFGQPTERDPMQLLIVSAQGTSTSERARLHRFTGSVLNYSPDGKQLVFDSAGLIQVVDVEGDAQPRVLPGQKGRNLDAHFSPDGKQIVFASNREE